MLQILFLPSLLYRNFPNIRIGLKPRFTPKEYTLHALSTETQHNKDP